MLDMKTEGIDVRPFRELTGQAMFNEVFFDDVFVPDDCLVGQEHDGWRATRTSLANERVFMGSGATIGPASAASSTSSARLALDDDTAHAVRRGRARRARATRSRCSGSASRSRALDGRRPVAAPRRRCEKLLGVEHDQAVQEVGLELAGGEGAVRDGDAAPWVQQFLFNRCLTIAGGTSEIQRNIIGERVLGLPRDP